MEGLGVDSVVLGCVEPAAEFQHPAVEAVKELVEAGLDLKIDANIPAGNREAQRRLVAGPEQLEHVQERIVSRLLNVVDDALELLDGLGRHHELILAETR